MIRRYSHKTLTFSSLALHFFYYTLKDFWKHNGLNHASSLAFTILLAFAPLLIVAFSIISLFPIFNSISQAFEVFIFSHFVPHTGQIILSYLLDFQAQSKKLSGIGFTFLAISAIMMLTTMETQLHELWNIKNPRRIEKSILIHWIILIVGPFLLFGSLFLSSLLFSSYLHFHKPDDFLILPFLLSVLAYTFLYKTLPGCPVKIAHALWGGFFSGLLFEGAKALFRIYIQHFSNYQIIYGALATIPIFLIWIYCCAVIFLLGGQIVNSLRIKHPYSDREYNGKNSG